MVDYADGSNSSNSSSNSSNDDILNIVDGIIRILESDTVKHDNVGCLLVGYHGSKELCKLTKKDAGAIKKYMYCSIETAIQIGTLLTICDMWDSSKYMVLVNVDEDISKEEIIMLISKLAQLKEGKLSKDDDTKTRMKALLIANREGIEVMSCDDRYSDIVKLHMTKGVKEAYKIIGRTVYKVDKGNTELYDELVDCYGQGKE